MSSNALTADALRTDENSRQFLKYVYSCAMPAGASMELVIDGVSYGTLHGGVGLAPEWGEANGSCDVTCQRWVTACLLARTNLYGIPVPISLRGEHRALKTTAKERADYPLREGTYFGNLFDPFTFFDKVGCEGPGSNSPQLTRRFCTGRTSECRFNLGGLCVNPTGEPLEVPLFDQSDVEYIRRACQRLDPTDGAVVGCYTGGVTIYGDNSRGELWKEAITVYLQAPRPVCGDGVCTAGESPLTCRDCSFGWARGFDFALDSLLGPPAGLPRSQGYPGGKFPALTYVGGLTALPDQSTFFAMGTAGTADLGAGHIQSAPGEDGILAGLYDPAGRTVWAKKVAHGPRPTIYNRVTAADADGNLYLLGAFSAAVSFEGLEVPAPAPPGPKGQSDTDLYLAKYTRSGERLWVHTLGGPGAQAPVSLVAAKDGSLYLTFVTSGSFDLGDGLTQATHVLAKLTSNGDLLWWKSLDFLGPGPTTCGDGTCAGDEDCMTCWDDCGLCSTSCNSGTPCDADETCVNCPAQCGKCPGTPTTVRVTDVGPDGSLLLIYDENDPSTPVFGYKPGAGTVWRYQTGTTETTFAQAKFDPDGNVVIASEFMSSFSDVTSSANLATYAPFGKRLWNQELAHWFTLPWVGGLTVRGLSVNGSGEILTFGDFSYIAAYGHVNWPFFLENEVYFPQDGDPGDVWVAKSDRTGTQLWARQLSSDAADAASALALRDDGVAVVAGTFNSTGFFDGWVLENLWGTPGIFLVAIPDPPPR